MFARLLNRSASVCWQFIYHTIQKRFQTLSFAKYILPVHHDDIHFDFGGRYLQITDLKGDLDAISKAINDRLGARIITLHTCKITNCFWHFPWSLTVNKARVSLSICTPPTFAYSSEPESTSSSLSRSSDPGLQSPCAVYKPKDPTEPQQPPSPEVYADVAPQTPESAVSSAALLETMSMISQMVQVAVEHSSLTINELQIHVILPASEDAQDKALLFTFKAASLRTSHARDPLNEIAAHFEMDQFSVQLLEGARVPMTPSVRSTTSPVTSSSLPTTPKNKGSTPWRRRCQAPKLDRDSNILWYAPTVRADMAWKERESVNLNLSICDTFMLISRRVLAALKHTEIAINTERSRTDALIKDVQDLPDFKSPESCQPGQEETYSPRSTSEKPTWPWLKSALMRLSRLYEDRDEEISSSGDSSVWGSSPGGTDKDFISMHSYFGLHSDDDEGDMESRSGGLSVDRFDKRVLNKLLQSTDEVKSYLLSELRKEEAESTADSRIVKVVLSPLLSLVKCLSPSTIPNERRQAFMELSEKPISVSMSLASMIIIVDPTDSVRLMEQDSTIYVQPVKAGTSLSFVLREAQLRADRDITICLQDARSQLVEAHEEPGSRLFVLSHEQLFAASMQALALPDFWLGHTQISPIEQMYALLAYPRPPDCTTPLISLLIEGPKEGTAVSDQDVDSDVVVNLSVSPLACCLSSRLKVMLHSLQALTNLIWPTNIPGNAPEQPQLSSAKSSCMRKSEEAPSSSRHSEATMDSIDLQPSVTFRIFGECLRVIAVQPDKDRAIVGLLSLENLSFYRLRNSFSFATDCLIGIGEASSKHVCLVPMVLTKDPLWFCFDPDVYFDEKSQVFQLTELPVAERPTATATLMDTPLPSIQIDLRDHVWREVDATSVRETQCSFPDITPSMVGLTPYLVADSKRALTSVYPPSLTSLLRRTQKGTSSSTATAPKEKRELKIRVLAIIFSWPRSFVVGWLTSLQPLIEMHGKHWTHGEHSLLSQYGLPFSTHKDQVREVEVVELDESKPTTWRQKLWRLVRENVEVHASVEKIIAHYIPKDPFTMAVAVTIHSINLSCDADKDVTDLDLRVLDLKASIYLFNQILLQWVQHKSCLTKRPSDLPAFGAHLTLGRSCSLKVDINNVFGEVNESLLLLTLLIYKELHVGHGEISSEPKLDFIQLTHPTETPCVREEREEQFYEIPGASEWFTGLESSISLTIQDVILSFTSDTVLQTIPVVLDLLRNGDISSWPSPSALMWGYELQMQRLSINMDFKELHMTRLREASVNMALALRETGTISITKTLEDAEGAIEIRRHGLFTIAEYGAGRDQLSSAVEIVKIKNLDLHFLEKLFFASTDEGHRIDTIKTDLLHISLSPSTIATLSRSFAQIRELLHLPIDEKHTLEDLLLFYFQQRGSTTYCAVTSTFYTPGVIPESQGAPAQSPPLPEKEHLTTEEATQGEEDDDVWEVDEYYTDLVAELGVSETWKESVIAAKPTPGPIWVPDFQIEVKSFICDLRAISMIDSCIVSLCADSLVFTLSYVQQECNGFVPHRKATFVCQSYHIRDTTYQSHYEFVCQPYFPSKPRIARYQRAIVVEIEAYRLSSTSSSCKELSSHTISGNASTDYLMIPSEPSSASSVTPAVRPSVPLPKILVEHSLNIILSPIWITLDMKTLSAINDFVETLEGLKKLQENTSQAEGVPSVEGLLQQELLGEETHINAISTITFLLMRSGLWGTCIALAACISDGHDGICETPGPPEMQSTPIPQNRNISEAPLCPGASQDFSPVQSTAPILIRSFESQELLVRFDFYSEGLDHYRLRQGGLIAALNFLAQLCTIEGLEVTFKRLKIEGLMTPKELMVRIVASSVADFDRSQVLQYAVRGTPVLRSLWDISASLKSLMNDALDQQECKPTMAMELAALRQLRQVFDSSEWSIETPPSSSKPASPKAADFTDALESFDYNERLEMILQITRRSFMWVEDQALLSLKTLAGQASGSLPFAMRLAEHSGDFLKCLAVESLKISERLMSTCSRRIAAIDTSVSQHLCLSSRLLKRRISMVDPPAKTTGDLGSPRWSFVERGATGFYEPRTAREGLQDAVVHLRRGWEQAYSIAEQVDFTRRNPWSVRGGDIMAENRAMLMSVVSLEALQAVGRVLPVLILKPIVTLAEAISSALQGTRNQVDPRQHIERTRSLRAPRISGEELLR